MIQRKAIGHPCPAIVAEDMRRSDAERIHQGDDILRHLPLGINGVAPVIGWRIAVAIAAQIGHDHVEFLGKLRRDVLPAMVVLRIAVEEDQRLARAAAVDRKLNLAASNAALRETFDHGAGHSLGCSL